MKDMTFQDVKNQNLILPPKKRYTVADVKKLEKQGFSIVRACFIVKCSAIENDMPFPKNVHRLHNAALKNPYDPAC